MLANSEPDGFMRCAWNLGLLIVVFAVSMPTCSRPQGPPPRNLAQCVVARRALVTSSHEQSVDFVPIGDGTSRPVFRSLRPEDALSHCGVKNGDVLLSINAVPMDSPERALEVRRRLSEDPEWRMVLSRQRQPFNVTITLQ